MILSFAHRYVFVHNRKAAGTAVKLALYPTLGPKDVAVGGWIEARLAGVPVNRRQRLAPFRAAQLRRTSEALRDRRDWSWIVNRASKSAAVHEFGVTFGHPTAGEIRRAFPEEWERYVKFTIVRNPYDRMYSDFRWRTRGRSRDEEVSFLRYLTALRDGEDLGGLVSPSWDAWQHLTVDGELVLDHYCRFEDLPTSFSDVLTANGIPWRGSLERVNAGAGGSRYVDAYGEEERELVAALCWRELAAFGYEFGDGR
jgi:hypothetical protein